ncbi:helix-turn-helix domain-containing protein [Arthrobacter cupressi]|uniref:Helix-turn-helix domain-containing protein n=1 Tax=Arthrobacter cupressi TaxID=1045773 RepID=A0A1G8LDH4_9MICC|nr:helix-turn-helix domain-containing protein [Arthrobacter cupressi]NYD77659.1 transcriptional regulator with XRE-family HTH domain/tetratricopeptide (TPR) repeat protein [Arthrobacter cupressi]SDI53676.1 Helix-turn-helix domain-containing protein [Arthrobacter cupressi]
MSPAGHLGALLRRHRRAGDLTLEALSERSGVSDRTISDIERGVSRGPQHRTMLALADALGLQGTAREQLLASARAGRRPASQDGPPVDPEPHRLADFTGRDAEIAAVVAHLVAGGAVRSTAAPVVLCGAPGVGKTSIAIEALHRCAPAKPRRLFVDLGGLDVVPLSPLQVLQSLLRQLTGEADVPRTLGEAATAWRSAIAATPAAVLLDDAANEAQIRPVLSPGWQGAVVVTSRRELAGLEGARRLTIGHLSRSESVALLERIVPPSQRGTGELEELAHYCNDIPLALRIAGNRLASRPRWTVQDLVQRLSTEERRLGALVAGDLAVESAFALSYGQLDEAGQTLFRRLSLLDGSSFGARVAGAVVGLGEGGAQDQLDGLVGLGLVEALHGDHHRLHDLLRLYAASRLRSEETAEAIAEHRRNLREWLLETTIAAGSRFEPRRPGPSSDALPAVPSPKDAFASDEAARRWLIGEAEHWFAAYRAAAARADHARVLAVADSLHWFSDLWLAWGRWHELYAASAAAAAAIADPSQQARHLGYLAWAQLVESFDPAAARTTAEAALAAAREAGDARQSGWAGFYLAWSTLQLGELDVAAQLADAAVTDFAAAGDVEGQLQARSIRTDIRGRRDPEASIGEYRELLDFLRESGDRLPRNIRVVTETNAHAVIALTLLGFGRYEEAMAAATDALGAGTPGEFPSGQAAAHRHRGFAARALGRDEAARADFVDALALGTGTRSEAWLGEVREALASVSPGARSDAASGAVAPGVS